MKNEKEEKKKASSRLINEIETALFKSQLVHMTCVLLAIILFSL